VPKKSLLVVEDEPGIRFSICRYFEAKGFEVWEEENCARGEERFRASRPDVTLLDYGLPDGDGLELLKKLRSIDETVPVVILTAHGSIDLAVRAIKEGAEQFLTKPIDLAAIQVVIERLLDRQRTQKLDRAERSRRLRDAADPFVGESPAVRRLSAESRRVLLSGSPILIQGETGSGKGVLARWLHENGPRSNEPFVELNCAGLSREFLETELFGHEKGAFTGATETKPGLLETAHGGSLFLDEIGDMDVGIQPKFLKVLEDQSFRRLGSVRNRRVDVRLIAASNQDLEELVRQGRFREDLYFRISALLLLVPPLRERRNDIAPLARKLIARMGTHRWVRPDLELTEEAERWLELRDWPGNIRELRNVLERAILRADGHVLNERNFAQDLSASHPTSTDWASLSLGDAQRRHIEAVLRKHRNSIADAAAVLGISRSALYQKIKKHGIPLAGS
jgi:DNA-binding NtrC family response regulator